MIISSLRSFPSDRRILRAKFVRFQYVLFPWHGQYYRDIHIFYAVRTLSQILIQALWSINYWRAKSRTPGPPKIRPCVVILLKSHRSRPWLTMTSTQFHFQSDNVHNFIIHTIFPSYSNVDRNVCIRIEFERNPTTKIPADFDLNSTRAHESLRQFFLVVCEFPLCFTLLST